MYRAFLQLDLLSNKARVSRALMHKFPGINTYFPQNRHLPVLKPYLLGRDKVVNAVWQTQIRYNSRQGTSPANCAIVPKKTHVPGSIHSRLTPASAWGSACCTYTCYLLLTHRAFCFCGRHRGTTGCTALALLHRQAHSLCKLISLSLC